MSREDGGKAESHRRSHSLRSDGVPDVRWLGAQCIRSSEWGSRLREGGQRKEAMP